MSKDKMNENAARINTLLTIIITALGLYLSSFILIGFLAVDFSIRAFTSKANIPIKYFTGTIIRLFDVKHKQIDAAQKRFAAELGFILSATNCMFLIFGNYFIANALGFILIFFAFFESAFNICVGCIIYTYFALPLLRRDDM